MTNRISKSLSILGISIIFLNLVFHIIGIPHLISPLKLSAVMTIFTSISLLTIFLWFISTNKKHKNFLIITSASSQLISLLSYCSPTKPEWSYLLNSSIPTSIAIFTILAFMFISENKFSNKKLKGYFGPILVLMNVIFLFSLITEKFFLLGYSKEHLGIGLSLYTLFLFFLISAIFCKEFTKVVSLNEIKINYSPCKIAILLISYALINFLLIYCDGKNILATSLAIHILFLISSYYLFLRPFLELKNKFITICAWSGNVKTIDGNWLKQEELFQNLGFVISHGISPDQVEKMRSQKGE